MSSTILKERKQGSTRLQTAPDTGWRSLGWFGLAMAIIGIGQLVLYFYPATGFGSPEWEYGSSAQMIGALPLPTVGLAAMLAAAFARGSRRGLIGLSVLLVVLGVMVFSALALFWTVAPMALRATPDPARDAIRQAIARTTLSGLGFGLLYMWAAVLAVRQVRRSPRRAENA